MDECAFETAQLEAAHAKALTVDVEAGNALAHYQKIFDIMDEPRRLDAERRKAEQAANEASALAQSARAKETTLRKTLDCIAGGYDPVSTSELAIELLGELAANDLNLKITAALRAVKVDVPTIEFIGALAGSPSHHHLVLGCMCGNHGSWSWE